MVSSKESLRENRPVKTTLLLLRRVQEIIWDVTSFARGRPLFDDITIMV